MRGQPGHAVGQPIALGAAELVGAARQVEHRTAAAGDRAQEPPAPAAEADLGRHQADGIVHVLGAALGPRRMLQAQVAGVRAHLDRDAQVLAVGSIEQVHVAAGRCPEELAQVLRGQATGAAVLDRDLTTLPPAAPAAHRLIVRSANDAKITAGRQGRGATPPSPTPSAPSQPVLAPAPVEAITSPSDLKRGRSWADKGAMPGTGQISLPPPKRQPGRPRKVRVEAVEPVAAPGPSSVAGGGGLWKLRPKAAPPAASPEPAPPPRRPEPSRTGGSQEREERRPFRNVEVRKLGPGRRHNRLHRGMAPETG